MALPIISAEERMSEKRCAKIALIGIPGSGKTSQIRTLDSRKTLFVDSEAGDLSILDWQGDTLRPRTWPEFRDLVVFLAGPMPTASADQAFSQAHFEHVCSKFGDPAQLAKYDTYFVDSLEAAISRVLRLASSSTIACAGSFALYLTPQAPNGRLQTSTLRRRINQRDWPGAGQELRRWVYGGGRVLAGLVTRRQAETALLE